MVRVKGKRTLRKRTIRRGGDDEEDEQRAAETMTDRHQHEAPNDAIHTEQDLVPSPALSSRYPTRSAVLSQTATLSPPLATNPIRSVRRTHSHPSTRTAARRILLDETHTEPFLPNEDNSSTSLLPLPPKDEQVAYSIAASSRYSGPDEPQHVHHEPLNDVVPREMSTNNSGRTTHSNITEYAKRLRDEMEDDPDEIESTIDPALEDVSGYKVKKEFAPLLKSIFNKYGDIASDCNLASPNIRSLFLERVCEVYEKLKANNFDDITSIQLDEMIGEVVDFERLMINVGWMREKLEQISGTKLNFSKYLDMKEVVANREIHARRMKERVGVYERKLSELQKKLDAAKDEVVEAEKKADQGREMVQDIRDRVVVLKRSWLDYLLI